jgi:putative DNA primase/helicase
MRAAGVNMDTGSNKGGHPIADGKVHRADAMGQKNKRHVWYVLHIDHPASGAFGDLKSGVQDTWTVTKDLKALSKEERATIAARIDQNKREREAELKALNAEAAEVSVRLFAAARKPVPEHAYIAKKGLPIFPGLKQLFEDFKYKIDGEAKTARAGCLVVPIYKPTAEKPVLVGVQLVQSDGVKRFVKGTAKEGNYHPIGRPNGGDIFIGEGYATCARVHEATGCLVYVAFDSGNLKSVAINIRKKFPDARLILLADNDRFTTKPVENPGLTKAREAAEAVKAIVAVPTFPDREVDATDFDDLYRLSGIEAVRRTIADAINPPMVDERNAPPIEELPFSDPGEGDPFGGDDDDGEHPLEFFGSPHFRCLGVDGQTCFYQPSDVSQVLNINASSHKLEALMMLAPLQWWEMEFPSTGKEGGVNMRAAVNACIRACKLKRKFVPHKTLRGRGAWFEGETPIFHSGDHLIVASKRVPISEHKSRYVYDEGQSIPIGLEAPLSTVDARRFLDLCKSLRWQSPLSGYLLAGWCVIAPVCGFLNWRPHMWISGEAGSGKSTVMDKIVKVCIGEVAHSVVGNTTEAGIRGALGMDALPIIFDEAEPRDFESKARIKSILDLARVAASESDGLILKGTSNQGTKGYRARSMFVFASINTQIEGYADETRFTQLMLQAPEGDKKSPENKQHYEALLLNIVSLLTPTFAQRLLARTILLLPALRSCVRSFTEAAAIHLESQRLGDQLGPLLAGAYLLNSAKEVSVADALAWIRKNDWADHSAKNATKDNERFMQHVTGYLVRHSTPEGGTWERTIGELIELAAYADDRITEGVDRVDNKKKLSAAASLARIGIRISHSSDQLYVEITSSHESFRKSVLKGTEWSGTRYRSILAAIPGAMPSEKNRYFCAGVNSPYVAVPINAVLKERTPGEDDE